METGDFDGITELTEFLTGKHEGDEIHEKDKGSFGWD
jgi:hypothetical protein